MEKSIKFRECLDSDIGKWVAARMVLWPSRSTQYHHDELERLRRHPDFVAFVAIDESDKLIGFCEASIRPYVNGCESSPAPFVEGCWIEPTFRGRGIGNRLVSEVERWAMARGFEELGSDSELVNELSHKAHLKWGFEETERVVYFRKKLNSR